MRKNSDHCSITSGVKLGHSHAYRGVNCQDAAVIAATPRAVVGVGCDGCGEGEHSEMGALALSNYAVRETLMYLDCYDNQALTSRDWVILMEQLFHTIVGYIKAAVVTSGPGRSPVEVAEFIKHYWLATIMGVIVLEDNCVIFSCGDGVYAFDDEIVSIDQDNRPNYIAYNALQTPGDFGVTEENIPTGFMFMELKNASRVMVASDGFVTVDEDKFSEAQVREPELLHNLNGQQWNKKGNLGLKKWMNSRSDRGYFDDDCFIITAERTAGREGEIWIE